MDQDKLLLVQKVAKDILYSMPKKPFFCLQLSALLYANLKDNHEIDSKLVSGNLTYKGQYIFKQDFEISKIDHSKFNLWAGHAWVEIENTIWDLSFFRSLYSEKFTKPYKTDLLQLFGEGRGILAFENIQPSDLPIKYHPVEYLSDELATRIIQGIDTMLDINW